MPTQYDVRLMALGLPETTEQDHHGMTSYRVRGRIFATVPDERHVRIMADEPEILAAVAEDPDTYGPFYWGKRLACVVVDASSADGERIRELLVDAWLKKAPKSAADAFLENEANTA
jgi:hypothetical protein